MAVTTKISVGVVGTTGMVGQVFLEILEKNNWPIAELRLFASENSTGKSIAFRQEKFIVQALQENCFMGLHLVFFSSGVNVHVNL